MGWEDREYNQAWGQGQAEPAGAGRVPPGTLTLMVLHGVGFLIYVMMRHDVGQETAELMQLDAEHRSVLGVLFHPFAAPGELGWGFLGLLLTLFILWKFVGPLEERYGPRRMLGLYVAGNLACGLAYWLVTLGLPLLATKPLATPVGAFAAWCGLIARQGGFDGLVILGRWWPAGRILLAVLGLVALLNLLSFGFGALGWLLAVGVALAVGPAWQWFGGLSERVRSRERPAQQRLAREVGRGRRTSDERAVDAADDVDDLLAKISRSGLESLTDAERERLERARAARLRGGR